MVSDAAPARSDS